jgi:NTE family protein
LNIFQQMLINLYKEYGKDAQAIRIGVGKQAEAATLTNPVTEADRRSIIATRLPNHEWPARKLKITAVDVNNGELVIFERESGVSLIDAVAASCAVPLVWPTVHISGRTYMDGGVRSGTNADLALGYAKVLILVPLTYPDDAPPILGSNLALEKALLEQQESQVMVIKADEAAIRAMGTNLLDPANRASSAQAGLAQGEKLVHSVSTFWL